MAKADRNKLKRLLEASFLLLASIVYALGFPYPTNTYGDFEVIALIGGLGFILCWPALLWAVAAAGGIGVGNPKGYRLAFQVSAFFTVFVLLVPSFRHFAFASPFMVALLYLSLIRVSGGAEGEDME